MSYNQPPYQYQQQSNGPPQPQWQQDPSRRPGWHDPRFSNPQSPPPQSPSATYQPVSYGPISGQPLPPPPPPPQQQYPPPYQVGPYSSPPQQPQQFDTSGWGVRYNQTLQHNQYAAPAQNAPALPPRPSSKPPEERPVTSSWNRPALVPLPDGTWQFPQYIPPETKAPTPPPRPPAQTTQQHYTPPATAQAQSQQRPTSFWNAGTTHANYQPPKLQTPVVVPPSHVSEGTISPIEDDRRSFTLAGRSDNISTSGKSEGNSPRPAPSKHASKLSISSSSNQPSGLSAGSNAFGPALDWQLYQPGEGFGGVVNEVKETKSPVESIQPVKTFATSSQLAAPMPVPQSEGPAHAHVHTVPSVNMTPKAEFAKVQSHSPEQLPLYIHPSRVQHPEVQKQSDLTGGPARSGTIDRVIEAWTTPLDTVNTSSVPVQSVAEKSREKAPDRPFAIPTADQYCQTDFPVETKIETRIETRVETKEVKVEVDPYADIKNEYAATLRRFADMLRQEAVADTDEKKFKTFQGFVIRELKLRSVLYGVDLIPFEPPKSDPTPNVDVHAVTTQTTPKILETSTVEEPKQTSVIEPVSKEGPSKDVPRPSTPKKTSLAIPERLSASPKDDSFVVVSAEDQDGEYSPGGRPRIVHARRQTNPPAVIITSSEPASTAQERGVPISPGANAPMTLDDYVMPDQPASPLGDAPIVVTADDLPQQPPISPLMATLSSPLKFQPPRPTYTPFRQDNRPVSPLPPLKEREPGETYHTMRQSQAAESGRMLSQELTSPPIGAPSRSHTQTPATGRVEHEEAFLGLIRRESKAIRKKPSNLHEELTQLRAGTPLVRNTPSPGIVSPLTKAVRSLRNAIPKTLVSEASVNPDLEQLVIGVAKLTDDFSFINATVITWDQANRGVRAKLDSERSERQTKNETRVNELFDDNEIGYADIGALEAEFKLNEADKKYQEDKNELDSFIKGVYDKVTTRIEAELAELGRLRLRASELLDTNSASAGARFQVIADGKGDKLKVPMAELMDLIIQLHAKIEIRHQKIAEAQFERERRRKRLELSVLYTNGDTPAVKKLEKEFSAAQLRLVVDEAQKKDERSNKLMDAFDRAVVRGLAENQAWIDDAQPRLQLVRDLVLGSDDHKPADEKERDALFYGVDGVRELMSQTQTALDLVISDSQKVVRLSNAVDVILNEADYAMYLAEEKLGESTAETFEKLKQDKIKEDDKIRADFEARLSGVDKAPMELVNLIREVSAKVGVDGGHGARIGKALEDAKRRNERHRGDSVSSPVLGGNGPGSGPGL